MTHNSVAFFFSAAVAPLLLPLPLSFFLSLLRFSSSSFFSLHFRVVSTDLAICVHVCVFSPVSSVWLCSSSLIFTVSWCVLPGTEALLTLAQQGTVRIHSVLTERVAAHAAVKLEARGAALA
jgi:hypothetical protein